MHIEGSNIQNKIRGFFLLVGVFQVLYIPLGSMVKYLDVSGLIYQLAKTNKLLTNIQIDFWYKSVFLIVASYAVNKLFKKGSFRICRG